MVNKRALGGEKEQLAASYLQKQGLSIIQMNYRCKIGEIDIVAKEKECLVFCEVKYRRNEEYGHPLAAVNSKKQHKITQTARYYMLTNNISEASEIRFDVVAILGYKITYVRNAF